MMATATRLMISMVNCVGLVADVVVDADDVDFDIGVAIAFGVSFKVTF